MFGISAEEWSAIALSLRVSCWAVAGSVVPGVAVAWLLARKRFPGRDLLNGIAPGTVDDLIDSGDVIALENTVDLPRVPPPPLPIKYDGRDKIASSKAIAVTRGAWATTPGTVLAGAIEVYDTALGIIVVALQRPCHAFWIGSYNTILFCIAIDACSFIASSICRSFFVNSPVALLRI